jgi:ABC-type Fe3+ transport system substrate-binding protein
MLVDRTKLDGVPEPIFWRDILKPEFRDKLIISSTGEGAANVPILYIYREYGENGVKRLAENIREIWPAARIAREAGSRDDGAAVYILSWFFAKSCHRTENGTVAVVWPEDGAYTSPLYLLVKKSKIESMSSIVKYMTGTKYGNHSSRFCLPVLNPDVDNSLPVGASLKWLGWDFVFSHDTAEMREYSQNLFMQFWKNRTL